MIKFYESLRNHKKMLYAAISIFIVCIYMLFFYTKYSDGDTSMFTVSILIVIILILMCIYSTNTILNGSVKYEKIFLTLIIPLGIIYTLLLPPGLIPDEWVHMENTFSLASQITARSTTEKMQLRESEIEYITINSSITNPSADYYSKVYNDFFSLDKNTGLKEYEKDCTPFKLIFSYFPAVIGTILSRFFRLGIITTVYVSRLFNFCFYSFLIYYSIKKISFGKMLTLIITLLPMSCQQMFSLSYDTVINSSSMICISYGLFFVYENRRFNFKDIIIYLLCGMLLVINKGSAYSFILLIPLLAKPFNPNNNIITRKKKIILFLTLVVMLLSIVYISLLNSGAISDIEKVSETMVPWTGTPSYTINILLSDLNHTINLIINTFIVYGQWLIDTMVGKLLCWLNVYLPSLLINAWFIMIIIASIFERSNKEVFTYRHKFLFIFISVSVIILVFLAMAIAWTPQGWNQIEGLQGRYFIPIAFLIFINLLNDRFYVKQKFHKFILLIVPFLEVITVFNVLLALYG